MPVSIDSQKPTRDRRPIWDRLPYGVRPIGNRWQLRVWFGGYKNAHYNFGLYPSIFSAERVAKKAIALKEQGLDYLEILRKLKDSGDVPAHVLPRWVYQMPDGRYGARCTWPEGKIHLKGFETPEAAHQAMCDRLEWLIQHRRQFPVGRKAYGVCTGSA